MPSCESFYLTLPILALTQDGAYRGVYDNVNKKRRGDET